MVNKDYRRNYITGEEEHRNPIQNLVLEQNVRRINTGHHSGSD